MTLFQTGLFQLHSGAYSTWKIDCDALTWEDIETLAGMVAQKLGYVFSAVEGVPQGGLRLAVALQGYCQASGPLVIVDDVLTTGESMEEQRAGRAALGCVIFARGPHVASWIQPLFRYEEGWR